jgi:hypothetical protein
MIPVPGIEPVLCIRVEDFATGPSEIDIINQHKAVVGKIPGKGTNLGSSEWN